MKHCQSDLFGAPVGQQIDFYGFLLKFARRMRGKVFTAEQVTTAAVAKGVLPVDAMRSTGSAFTRAAKEGHIKRANAWYRRKFGNGTQARAWMGC